MKMGHCFAAGPFAVASLWRDREVRTLLIERPGVASAASGCTPITNRPSSGPTAAGAGAGTGSRSPNGSLRAGTYLVVWGALRAAHLGHARVVGAAIGLAAALLVLTELIRIHLRPEPS
jgi:hypothetical protein